MKKNKYSATVQPSTGGKSLKNLADRWNPNLDLKISKPTTVTPSPSTIVNKPSKPEKNMNNSSS